MYNQEREFVKVNAISLFFENLGWLYRHIFSKPGKVICMRMIRFYQKYLSRKTCRYTPTCSEYTMRCINNHGALIGILLGAWRILRCNPFSKGGYDPAPERYFARRWLL